MNDPTAQYDYEERQNFLEAQRAGKETGLDDGPPNSIIKDNDQNHACFYCGRSLTAERQKVAELVDALRLMYEHTADYIRINHLGDVHHNASMQVARDVLTKYQPTEGKVT